MVPSRGGLTTARRRFLAAILSDQATSDYAGQPVRTLVAQHQRAGHYAVRWDATDAQGQPVAAGLYFHRLQAGAFRAVGKMLLLK